MSRSAGTRLRLLAVAIGLALLAAAIAACGQQAGSGPSAALPASAATSVPTTMVATDTPTATLAAPATTPAPTLQAVTSTPAPTMVIATGTAAPSSLTVTDMLGRTVTVPAAVDKIACAGPGALRLIVYLQAQNKVIGVEDAEKNWGVTGRPYIMAHPELKELPSIGPGGPGKLPDADALVKLNPQVLFLTYVDARTADNIQEKTKVPVVVLAYGDDPFGKELFGSLRLAGSILGAEGRAESVVTYISQALADLTARTEGIADADKPSAYVGCVGYAGAHGIESTQAKFAPLAVVHAKNVADELGTGHQTVDREKLLQWDPEVIFIDEGGLELLQQDYGKNADFYRSLAAVKAGKVYGLLPYNYYTTNVETALADSYFAGTVLYPDQFKDVEAAKKADEIYNFFVGKAEYEEMRQAYGGFGKLDMATGRVE